MKPVVETTAVLLALVRFGGLDLPFLLTGGGHQQRVEHFRRLDLQHGFLQPSIGSGRRYGRHRLPDRLATVLAVRQAVAEVSDGRGVTSVRTWRFARLAYLAVLACLCLLPFYWMVIGAVGPSSNLTGEKVSWWPGGFSLNAFADVWSAVPLLRYLGNSLLVGALTTLVSVSIAFLGAYALVRYRPKGAGIITAFVLFTLTIPGVSALVPYYDLLTRIDALEHALGPGPELRRLGTPLRYVVTSRLSPGVVVAGGRRGGSPGRV